jgi:phenylacetate-CoA ligase
VAVNHACAPPGGGGGALGEHTIALAIEEAAFAYEHVPFFRDHVDVAGVHPRELTSAAAFRRVPPTRKADYRRGFPAGVLATGTSLDDPLVVRSQSSGTGGDRLLTATYAYDLAARLEATLDVHPPLRHLLTGLVSPRAVRYAAPNCSDVECSSPYTTMRDRTLPDGSLVLSVAHDLLATPDRMIDQAIAEIAEWRPHGFDADPTHLAFLARCYRRRALPAPDCQALVLGYTRATGVARRQVEECFGPAAISAEVLGMSELGWLVLECPSGSMHLNDRTFHVELLVDGRPAAAGELAELVVTSLGDRLSPHVRYQTGDLYRLAPEPCACGHPYPVVTHEGRRRDLVQLPSGGQLTPRDVDVLVGRAPWIDVYRLEQAASGDLWFRCIVNDRYEESARRELEDRLAEAVGHRAELEFEVADYIASDRSGKLIACASAVSERAQ